jgi:hypothetical protein
MSVIPLPDSLPREHRVFSNRGPVGDFGFVDGPFAGETPVVSAGGGSLLPCERPNPQLPCPGSRTDPEPCSNGLFFESRTGFSVSPALRLFSPRGLRAFLAKVGGLLGGDRHERARMDRFGGAVSP